MDEFNCLRNIHTKLATPKLFENMIFRVAKPIILAGNSKFQIGAIPNHRAQEHLFTLKSVIQLGQGRMKD